MPSLLEQYRVSDFLDWHRQKRLELNPEFQRRAVWTPTARSYLVDSVLRGLPIPKIYLRTKIDVTTKQSIREVVDGQQRIRAILDFAEDRFQLTRRAGEFSGLKYSTLSETLQAGFLGYAIAVDQLLNATDDEVLEVFSRLNSYSVALNGAEKRHAKYQGDFKWAVHEASKRWSILWDTYHVVSVRQRVRMLDDSLMAEMFGILLHGVSDGGEGNIKKLYDRHEKAFPEEDTTVASLNRVLRYFIDTLAVDLRDTALLGAPHFLMLFAALAHALVGIPQGELDTLPPRSEGVLSNPTSALANLMLLASVIEADTPPAQFAGFWLASKSSTHRIGSRAKRFPTYYSALLPSSL